MGHLWGKPFDVRFREKIRLDGPVLQGMDSRCHIWIGAAHPQGYGVVNRSGRMTRATHIALEFAGRALQCGQWALHRCDNPQCVNPEHLFAGTVRDNNIDCFAKGRRVMPRLIGSDNPRAKLADADVIAMRSARRTGETLRSIAHRYGVARPVAANAIQGKTWKHVKEGLV